MKKTLSAIISLTMAFSPMSVLNVHGAETVSSPVIDAELSAASEETYGTAAISAVQSDTVNYGTDPFFIVTGKHSKGPGAEDETEMRFYNIEKEGWYGGNKVVWRDAPSDLVYGDVLVPENDTSMTLLDTDIHMYPSSYYWDLDDGTKLRKIGNCEDIMEQKILTATHFDYLAHQWYGMDYTDGEKSYRYSENIFASYHEVSGCGSEDDVIRFAVYGDTLLLPLETIENASERRNKTTTTTTTTASTTTTTTVTTTAPAPSAKVHIGNSDLSGEEVAGAVLSLTGTDADGNNITFKEEQIEAGADVTVRRTSGESLVWVSGTEAVTVTLADGKYKIHEITAPDGYEKAGDIEFTIKNGEADLEYIDLISEPIEDISTTESTTETTTTTTTTAAFATSETTTLTETETTAAAPITTETTTTASGEELPQTGNNSIETPLLLSLSASLILTGSLAVYGSGIVRRKEEE